MNPALNIALGLALAGLDLLGLRWFALGLGQKSSSLGLLLKALFLMGKFAVLAGVVYLVKDRAWFMPGYFAGGLGAPFIAYFAWEAKKHVSQR